MACNPCVIFGMHRPLSIGFSYNYATNVPGYGPRVGLEVNIEDDIDIKVFGLNF